MKAVISNEYTIKLGEEARLSSISQNYTFIRIKKGPVADLGLVRAASAGLFDLDDQGEEWRLTIKTECVKWEE